jgi:uncharacterized repeat protein (TIGR03803 family)
MLDRLDVAKWLVKLALHGAMGISIATTHEGGANGCGVVYRIAPDNTFCEGNTDAGMQALLRLNDRQSRRW